MSDCESVIADLDAYRDRALAPERSEQIEQHLGQCAGCRDRLKADDALEQAIRVESRQWKPPQNLMGRIRDSVRETRPLRRRAGDRRYWALAAMLMLAVAVVAITSTERGAEEADETIASVLVNEFHTFVISRRALDYSGSEPAAIRDWFSEKVEFRVPKPIWVEQTKLSGGRLCNMLNQRVVSFMYRADQSWVSLYILQPTDELSEDAIAQTRVHQGYGYIGWQKDGLLYALIGDVPVEQLRLIADRLKTLSMASETTPRTPAGSTLLGRRGHV